MKSREPIAFDGHERTTMSMHDFGADIEAVRAALLRLRDNDDELLGTSQFPGDQEEPESLHRRHLPARRALVSELIDFLDAREDTVDLQVRNGLDPFDLLFGPGPEP